jgi:(4S)-4-hydroxy-5-phosphonooxypentane-2,3-dione isomerase
MVIIHVHIKVQADQIESFKRATVDNAQNSVQEPGCLVFDVVQRVDDPSLFVLVEAYRDEAAVNAHRSTEHYQRWRSVAEPLMAEPRTRFEFQPIFPEPSAWAR